MKRRWPGPYRVTADDVMTWGLGGALLVGAWLTGPCVSGWVMRRLEPVYRHLANR